MSPAQGAVIGAMVAAGILLVIIGCIPTDAQDAQPARLAERLGVRLTRRQLLLLTVGLALGVIIAATTGWVIAVPTLPLLALALPWLLLPERDEREDILKAEALEEWLRSLRGLLLSNRELQQALVATRATAAPAIAPAVNRLAARIQARRPITEALYLFGDDLDDPLADTVVSALLLADRAGGTRLSEVLEALSEMLTRKVRSRRSVERARSGPRRNGRIVSLIVIFGFSGVIFATPFGQAYHTPTGQLVLAGFIAGIGGCIYWIHLRSQPPVTYRFLIRPTRQAIDPIPVLSASNEPGNDKATPTPGRRWLRSLGKGEGAR